jgi:hypothetical protein
MNKVLWYLGVVICALGWGGLALILFVAFAFGGLSDGTPPLQDLSFWAFVLFWLVVVSGITAGLVWSGRRVK